YNMTQDLRQYVELSYPGLTKHSFQFNMMKRIVTNMAALDDQLNELLRRLDTTFTKFITQATLPCTAFLSEEECSRAEEALTFAGKCFRIPGKIQILPGYGMGRTVIVNLPIQFYHLGSNNFANDGLIIKLAASNKGIDNDLSFVPAGVHSLISITATKYSFLNDPPKYTCEEGDNRNYSRVWCYDACLTERAEQTCNCSLTASMDKMHTNLCTPKELFNCYYNNVDHGSTPQNVKKQQECKKRCTAPCEYWTYSKTVSYSKFPAEHARELMQSDEEFDALKRTVVIDAFYTELEYTVIKHIRNLPLSSAIAQFGGQLSLWAGASVMSMAQLVIYFIYIVIHHILRFGERKSSSLHSPGGFVSRSQEIANSLSPTPRCAEEEIIDIEDDSSPSRRVSINL
ncbi:hypothetical protein PFISCL1PPCAC_27500, partial [Pristionchus fissidentatus]